MARSLAGGSGCPCSRESPHRAGWAVASRSAMAARSGRFILRRAGSRGCKSNRLRPPRIAARAATLAAVVVNDPAARGGAVVPHQAVDDLAPIAAIGAINLPVFGSLHGQDRREGAEILHREALGPEIRQCLPGEISFEHPVLRCRGGSQQEQGDGPRPKTKPTHVLGLL